MDNVNNLKDNGYPRSPIKAKPQLKGEDLVYLNDVPKVLPHLFDNGSWNWLKRHRVEWALTPAFSTLGVKRVLVNIPVLLELLAIPLEERILLHGQKKQGE